MLGKYKIIKSPRLPNCRKKTDFLNASPLNFKASFQSVTDTAKGLPDNYSIERESYWSSVWEKEAIYKFHPHERDKEIFSIDTPPPTISGALHVGHIFSYSHTDIIARYQRMKNKNVFYSIGWDDNGLPTERRVQNHYNIWCSNLELTGSDIRDAEGVNRMSGSRAVVSREKFAEFCSNLIEEDEAQFESLFRRIALSVDWDNTYRTIAREPRYLAQLSFLHLLEKDQVYQAISPTLWDCEFRTAIAQAEVVDKLVPGTFYTIKFFLQFEPSTWFLVVTTRPELLAACVAIAVHPEDGRYGHLVGKMAVTPLFHVPVPIVADVHVEREKGTGVLMVCTFGDALDVELWRANGFPIRCVIGKDGLFEPVEFSPSLGSDVTMSLDHEAASSNYLKLVGKSISEGRKIVVGLLGPLVIEKVSMKHEVRFFEKGSNPLEIIPTRQWYARIMDKKEVLLNQGSLITWHPCHMRKKYDDWVMGLQNDWCISRQRYFGVPLPVYYRVDSAGQVLYGELILPSEQDLPIDPTRSAPRGYDESQRGQSGGFIAEEDIFDTWWTSSLTPQIITGWRLKKPFEHQRLFPLTLRPQSHEIIRTWTFYTIFKSLMHEGRIPWKHIAISGWIVDRRGVKVSKSANNAEHNPFELMDRYGADAVRYWCASVKLGYDAVFDLSKISVGKRLAIKLFNAAKLAFSQCSMEMGHGVTEPLDIAILLQLGDLVAKCNEWFDEYRFSKVLRETENFFWSRFTDNYLEMIKSRVKDHQNAARRCSAILTMRVILNVFLRLWAPIMPHITEEIWSWEFGSCTEYKYVHMAPYPEKREIDSLLGHVPEAEIHKKIKELDSVIQCMNVLRKAKFDSKLKYSEPVTVGMLHVNNFKQLEPYWEDMLYAIRAKEFKIIEDDTVHEGQFIAKILT